MFMNGDFIQLALASHSWKMSNNFLGGNTVEERGHFSFQHTDHNAKYERVPNQGDIAIIQNAPGLCILEKLHVLLFVNRSDFSCGSYCFLSNRFS